MKYLFVLVVALPLVTGAVLGLTRKRPDNPVPRVAATRFAQIGNWEGGLLVRFTDLQTGREYLVSGRGGIIEIEPTKDGVRK